MDALRFSAVLLILAMACFMTVSAGACEKPKVEGTGSQSITSYFFNSASGTCDMFVYKGGNDETFPNRFNSHPVCENVCKCKLRMDPGTGERLRTRYYHNTDGSGCLPFQYRGTGGNANNFLSESACEMECEL
nr:conotoxin precursor conkunitzin [Conus judaeus]